MSGPFDTRLPEEGAGIVAAAQARGLAVRLMGGVGIRLLLGDRCRPALERAYRDLDVIVRRRDARAVEALLADRGWEPAAEFNALNGARRLLFHDPASEAQVDVFVEAFEMCHKLPLADSLDRPGPSLPAIDLLMSKLQIVSLNAKDRGDCYALLAGCPVADGDPAAIEPDRLAALTADDWGLHHTFELNLGRLRDGLAEAPLDDADRAGVRAALGTLDRAMDEAPKSRGWKLRARIGERKRWYDEPEEVDRTAEA
jgi:hypothetical protein